MTDDTISRAAAIKAADSIIERDTSGNNDVVKAMTAWKEYIKGMPPAQPGQRNARVFQGIIVEYPTISTYPEYEGKPYFSIKYTENGQEFIGYGTYKPEVLSEYLKEYFMCEKEDRMAEFQKVIKERNRMCDSYETCIKGCPLGKTRNCKTCSAWILENPALAEVTIMQWAAEHKTNRDKFKEVFGMDLVITGNTNEWLDQEYKENNEQKLTRLLHEVSIPVTPSKEDEPGHWIDKGSLSCRCSKCGCKSPKEYPYCPNCGTPMEK